MISSKRDSDYCQWKKRPILQLIPTITWRMGFLLAIYNSLSYIVSNSKLPANITDNN
jgi:hypothetical protein